MSAVDGGSVLGRAIRLEIARGLRERGVTLAAAEAKRAAIYCPGSRDPGGWAPRALFTIHREGTALPDEYSAGWLEWWEALGDRLGSLGFGPLYFECVNGAVFAAYSAELPPMKP